MVKTMADILNKVINFEKEKIENFKYQIKHCPTIGEQYEGITIKGLSSIFPKELNINVVSGFICNNNKKLSPQIDCMLVYGIGKLLPGTKDKYIYSLSQVIAIFEIKKNLFTDEMSEAYSQLYSIISSDFDDNFYDFTHSETEIFNNCYAVITGKNITSYEEGKNQQNPFLEYIYHGLLNNFREPLRIIFGYNGFSNEESLRNKYLEFLKSNMNKKGFGPFSHPNMIICGNNCLLKLTAEPYSSTIFNNSSYLFYASSSNHNIQILVELILARLSRKISIDFSEDSQLELLNPYLGAQLVENDTTHGWNLIEIPLNYSAQNATNKWQPTFVSEKAFTIFNILCKKGYINLAEKNFIDYDKNNPKIIDEMLNTKLVAIDKNNIMTLISTNLVCLINTDGRYCVGDNAYGYFTNWLTKTKK